MHELIDTHTPSPTPFSFSAIGVICLITPNPMLCRHCVADFTMEDNRNNRICYSRTHRSQISKDNCRIPLEPQIV